MNESRKFYKAINAAKKSFHARVSVVKRKDGSLVCDKNGVLERWKQHFNELLNPEAEGSISRQRYTYETDDGKEFDPPSFEEVAQAISSLKNNKAPGMDNLPAELFKTGSEELFKAMHALIVRVWTEERLPDEWMIGVICPIHKKGCKMTCTNYRGISLLPSAYKVLSKVLSSRLEPLTEDFLSEYQAGFRKQRSTSDQLFGIRQIVQKSYEMNVETLHLFIDFRAAYDSIDREGLWKIMAESSFPHKLIRLLKATLAKVMCCVKVQASTSNMFECKVGLRQGDELSTKLFNIALEGVFRRADLERSGTIFTKSTQLLGFADDVDIVGRNIRSITDAYSKMEREANKIGLYVNEEKTKLLMVAASERTKNFVGSHLKIGDKNFEVVNEFCYLGALISNNHDTSLEIKRRILAAQRAFFGVKHLLKSKRISRQAKVTMYKTLIRPVALYGSESWNMTGTDEHAIGVFERRILRVIFGPKRDGELFKSRSNMELYQIFNEADIVKRIKVNRLRWAGHVIRRPVEAPLNKVFKSDFLDGRRLRGRPKNSWKEAVDRDSIALGIGNWQSVASDRASYRQKLREVMDHN
jgi:sorting nexin-29